MPLPSLYNSENSARPWSVTWAAGYGAGVGALAALFKTLGPLRASAQSGGLTERIAGNLVEIAGAVLVFAALCAAAAALRNFIAQHLVWRQGS
jgi:hypothetical protein